MFQTQLTGDSTNAREKKNNKLKFGTLLDQIFGPLDQQLPMQENNRILEEKQNTKRQAKKQAERAFRQSKVVQNAFNFERDYSSSDYEELSEEHFNEYAEQQKNLRDTLREEARQRERKEWNSLKRE